MAVPTPTTGKDLRVYNNLPRSALLSYIARAGEDQNRFHYTLSALEPHALWQWITQYLGNRIGPRHRFLTYPPESKGIYHLGDESVIGGSADPDGEVRISIAGDWGTGTDEANEVAARISAFTPHYTIHLGDVYYVGTEDEVDENCLGRRAADNSFIPCLWPLGSVGSFALNGNHEMYALGDAYFSKFLPKLGIRTAPGKKPSGQLASFLCLENPFWRVIGLDTGYNSIGIPVMEYIFSPSCKLRNEELAWLRDQVNPKGDTRGLILLTHHQYCSAFDTEYPKTAIQLAQVIDRPVLWFWGHEHRMAIYGKYAVNGGIQAFGRCLGHGGMPVAINPTVKRPDRPLAAFDNRQYPSPENIVVGYNGFANLIFRNNRLAVEYRDLKDRVLLIEQWQVDNGVLTGKASVPNQAPGLDSPLNLVLATS
jgi:hypothetical protein